MERGAAVWWPGASDGAIGSGMGAQRARGVAVSGWSRMGMAQNAMLRKMPKVVLHARQALPAVAPEEPAGWRRMGGQIGGQSLTSSSHHGRRDSDMD